MDIHKTVDASMETLRHKYKKCFRNYDKSFAEIIRKITRALNTAKIENELETSDYIHIESQLREVAVKDTQVLVKLSGLIASCDNNRAYTKLVKIAAESLKHISSQIYEALEELIKLQDDTYKQAQELKEEYNQIARSTSSKVFLESFKGLSNKESSLTIKDLIELQDAIKRLVDRALKSGYHSRDVQQDYINSIKSKEDIITAHYDNQINAIQNFTQVHSLTQRKDQIADLYAEIIRFRKEGMLYINSQVEPSLAKLSTLTKMTVTAEQIQKLESAWNNFESGKIMDDFKEAFDELNTKIDDTSSANVNFKPMKFIKKLKNIVLESGYLDMIQQMYEILGIKVDFDWEEFKDKIGGLIAYSSVYLDRFVMEGENRKACIERLLDTLTHENQHTNISVIKTFVQSNHFKVILQAAEGTKGRFANGRFNQDDTGAFELGRLTFTYNILDSYEIIIAEKMLDSFIVNILRMIDGYWRLRYQGKNVNIPINITRALRGGQVDENELYPEYVNDLGDENEIKGGSIFEHIEFKDTTDVQIIPDAVKFYICAIHIVTYYIKSFTGKFLQDGDGYSRLQFKVHNLSNLKIFDELFNKKSLSPEVLTIEQLKQIVSVLNDIWNQAGELDQAGKLSRSIDILLSELNASLIFTDDLSYNLMKETHDIQTTLLDSMDGVELQRISDEIDKVLKDVVIETKETPEMQSRKLELYLQECYSRMLTEDNKFALLRELLIHRKDTSIPEYYKFMELVITPLLILSTSYQRIFRLFTLHSFNVNMKEYVIDDAIYANIKLVKSGQVTATINKEYFMESNVVMQYNRVLLHNAFCELERTGKWVDPKFWLVLDETTYPSSQRIPVLEFEDEKHGYRVQSIYLIKQIYPLVQGSNLSMYFTHAIQQYKNDYEQLIKNFITYPGLSDKAIHTLTEKSKEIFDKELKTEEQLNLLSALKSIRCDNAQFSAPNVARDYFLTPFSESRSYVPELACEVIHELTEETKTEMKFVKIVGDSTFGFLIPASQAGRITECNYNFLDFVLIMLSKCDTYNGCVSRSLLAAMQNDSELGPLIPKATIGTKPTEFQYSISKNKYVPNLLTQNIVARTSISVIGNIHAREASIACIPYLILCLKQANSSEPYIPKLIKLLEEEYKELTARGIPSVKKCSMAELYQLVSNKSIQDLNNSDFTTMLFANPAFFNLGQADYSFIKDQYKDKLFMGPFSSGFDDVMNTIARLIWQAIISKEYSFRTRNSNFSDIYDDILEIRNILFDVDPRVVEKFINNYVTGYKNGTGTNQIGGMTGGINQINGDFLSGIMRFVGKRTFKVTEVKETDKVDDNLVTEYLCKLVHVKNLMIQKPTRSGHMKDSDKKELFYINNLARLMHAYDLTSQKPVGITRCNYNTELAQKFLYIASKNKVKDVQDVIKYISASIDTFIDTYIYLSHIENICRYNSFYTLVNRDIIRSIPLLVYHSLFKLADHVTNRLSSQTSYGFDNHDLPDIESPLIYEIAFGGIIENIINGAELNLDALLPEYAEANIQKVLYTGPVNDANKAQHIQDYQDTINNLHLFLTGVTANGEVIYQDDIIRTWYKFMRIVFTAILRRLTHMDRLIDALPGELQLSDKDVHANVTKIEGFNEMMFDDQDAFEYKVMKYTDAEPANRIKMPRVRIHGIQVITDIPEDGTLNLFDALIAYHFNDQKNIIFNIPNEEQVNVITALATALTISYAGFCKIWRANNIQNGARRLNIDPLVIHPNNIKYFSTYEDVKRYNLIPENFMDCVAKIPRSRLQYTVNDSTDEMLIALSPITPGILPWLDEFYIRVKGANKEVMSYNDVYQLFSRERGNALSDISKKVKEYGIYLRPLNHINDASINRRLYFESIDVERIQEMLDSIDLNDNAVKGVLTDTFRNYSNMSIKFSEIINALHFLGHNKYQKAEIHLSLQDKIVRESMKHLDQFITNIQGKEVLETELKYAFLAIYFNAFDITKEGGYNDLEIKRVNHLTGGAMNVNAITLKHKESSKSVFNQARLIASDVRMKRKFITRSSDVIPLYKPESYKGAVHDNLTIEELNYIKEFTAHSDMFINKIRNGFEYADATEDPDNYELLLPVVVPSYITFTEKIANTLNDKNAVVQLNYYNPCKDIYNTTFNDEYSSCTSGLLVHELRNAPVKTIRNISAINIFEKKYVTTHSILDTRNPVESLETYQRNKGNLFFKVGKIIEDTNTPVIAVLNAFIEEFGKMTYESNDFHVAGFRIVGGDPVDFKVTHNFINSRFIDARNPLKSAYDFDGEGKRLFTSLFGEEAQFEDDKYMFSSIMNHFNKFNITFNSMYNTVMFPSSVYGSRILRYTMKKLYEGVDDCLHNLPHAEGMPAFIHKYFKSIKNGERYFIDELRLIGNQDGTNVRDNGDYIKDLIAGNRPISYARLINMYKSPSINNEFMEPFVNHLRCVEENTQMKFLYATPLSEFIRYTDGLMTFTYMTKELMDRTQYYDAKLRKDRPYVNKDKEHHFVYEM